MTCTLVPSEERLGRVCATYITRANPPGTDVFGYIGEIVQLRDVLLRLHSSVVSDRRGEFAQTRAGCFHQTLTLTDELTVRLRPVRVLVTTDVHVIII